MWAVHLQQAQAFAISIQQDYLSMMPSCIGAGLQGEPVTWGSDAFCFESRQT